MIPRGRLHISYTDVLLGIYYCLCDFFKLEKTGKQEERNSVVCLSMRTGFDLALSALNLPPGSEILVTNINIPDMFSIIAAHGLLVVPLSVNKHTLGLSPGQVEAAITPLTKAILITHLFGGVMETDSLVQMAKKNNVIVFEDCAQAFAGSGYGGNSLSDVLMFSFGFIKTNTAISGAMLRINDPLLRAEVVFRGKQYPLQANTKYLKKLLKAFFIKLLTQRALYTLFYKAVTAIGKDFDETLSGFTKGFLANDVLKQIRYQPCAANERLIERRLSRFEQAALLPRTKLAHDILENIPGHYKIGALNKKHTFWVLPVETGNADDLVIYLRENGFDASQKASSLVKLKPANDLVTIDDLNLEKLVYLPMYPEMSSSDRNSLIRLLNNYSANN